MQASIDTVKLNFIPHLDEYLHKWTRNGLFSTAVSIPESQRETDWQITGSMVTQSKETYFLCNWFNYELTGRYSLSCYVLHTNNYFFAKELCRNSELYTTKYSKYASLSKLHIQSITFTGDETEGLLKARAHSSWGLLFNDLSIYSQMQSQEQEYFQLQIGLQFREENNKILHLEHRLVGRWNLDSSESTSEMPGKFPNVVLETGREDQLDRSFEK